MKWLVVSAVLLVVFAVFGSTPIPAAEPKLEEIEWASVPSVSSEGTYTLEIKNDLPQLLLFGPKGYFRQPTTINGTRTGNVTKFVFKKPSPQMRYFNFHKGDVWGAVFEDAGSGVVGTKEFERVGENIRSCFKLMASPQETPVNDKLPSE